MQIKVMFDGLPDDMQHKVPDGEIIECVVSEMRQEPDGTVVMVLKIHEPATGED